MTHDKSRSEKIKNLQYLRDMADYIKDMNEQILTQHPQPSGAIFLNGETINLDRYTEAVNVYNELATKRNAYTNDRIPMLTARTFYDLKRKRDMINRGAFNIVKSKYNSLEFACSIQLFSDLWKVIMGKKYWAAYTAELSYANSIN